MNKLLTYILLTLLLMGCQDTDHSQVFEVVKAYNSDIDKVQRDNIKFALERSYLVDNSLVKETYDMASKLSRMEQWILTAARKRMENSFD